jgi:hypothetical protein
MTKHRNTGKLIEFPRRLEWKHVDTYIGTIAGTSLHARVQSIPDGEGAKWEIWLGHSLISFGTAEDEDAGMEAARSSLEKSVLVARPVSGNNNSGGSTNDER